MITPVLIIVGVILSIVAVLVFVLSLARAPEGIEDETGFRYVKETPVVRSRYYCAKGAPVRPAVGTTKPFKARIPAA